ncbi:GLPGLI family protein [Pedobacter sp. GR22-6]|uniref:GLPGLI family protein n=1 Tax=Pedobacter sp. GR22-6 TaxID=3127957 RepID=UPI00307E590C
MSLPNATIRLFFLFALFCQASAMQAQVKGTLNYSLTIDDGMLSQPRIVNSIVYFSGGQSLELNLPKQVANTKVADGDNSITETMVVNPTKKRFVYKDTKTKKLLLGDDIAVKFYLISDTLSNFKWKISKEQKKILNYNCTKATTTFRGRNYEAWFTDDIAISNGPWKFCGLPGLIVAVNDLNSVFSYKLTGINLKAKFDPAILALPKSYAKDKATTHSAFMKAYKERLSKNEALARVVETSGNGVTSSTTIKLPEKQEKY